MTTGIPPAQGQKIGMPDFFWLNGLAGGNNRYFQTAAGFPGGGQLLGTPIGVPNAQGIEAALVLLNPVATAGDSFQLPQAGAGKTLLVFNNTLNSANIFAEPILNRASGTLDVINALTNPTAYPLAAGQRALFFCPANGIWAAILSA